ncbi:EPIDERMAL PATTERNING FACTOR-like protein 5 [Lotus japonicus]|uniref:EPIDERMAL PATTERNING FACTOR-like protein 5 n=1 Tax=Lotus japonicus TaxID=34305 RepID=UPI002587DBDA|nr:EPIDERMAL PATTERNING FACTOR-like protein 5 [Lotus japonicus]
MVIIRHLRRRKHHQHHHWLQAFTTFTFLFLSSASAMATLSPQPSGGAVKHPFREENENGSQFTAVADQKRLGGPGSSPPSCRSKCGWCSPCQPVHIPVQPGLIIRLEYYPEAWRCKCGNKLFMP